ncbi:MAG: hypothetical protein Q4F80_02410, partial [bacterium]|nr:hypothetical protein [bacterium]
QEFKTGLRKAVSVLNSAITMNMALDGETPYDNKDLWGYLQRHMSIMKSTTALPWRGKYVDFEGNAKTLAQNAAFYTVDGIRFEFDDDSEPVKQYLPLHENSNVFACFPSGHRTQERRELCGGCGSLGLTNNPNNTTKPPCMVMVDVNGDKKPTPSKVTGNYSTDLNASDYEIYKAPPLDSKRIGDIFVILITEDRAVPYGVVAQRAMYQAQKNN